MPDHKAAVKSFGLALEAAKAGNTKLARHHGGHAFRALHDQVSGSGMAGHPKASTTGFVGGPMREKGSTSAPPTAPNAEPGEGEVDPSGMDDQMGAKPPLGGGGLMARLKSFSGLK